MGIATKSRFYDLQKTHKPVLDKDMKQVGVINEIARGERVYAARFVGKLAYFILDDVRATNDVHSLDFKNCAALSRMLLPCVCAEYETASYFRSRYYHYRYYSGFL